MRPQVSRGPSFSEAAAACEKRAARVGSENKPQFAGDPTPDSLSVNPRPSDCPQSAALSVSVVLVDDDPKALEKLSKMLTEAAGWLFRSAWTGGEALDVVTQERPQIVMVKEDLPDLPGSMVVHTVKSSSPDAVTLLYTPPGRSGRPGEVKLVDTSGTMNTVASYAEPGQLAAPLGEIREALRAKSKERRYLQAFRQRHFEFLQRYNNIKHRLKEELDRRKKKLLG